jgi:hypothetical protein
VVESDRPNVFQIGKLASGGLLTVVEGCINGARKKDPLIPRTPARPAAGMQLTLADGVTDLAQYCACTADAMEANASRKPKSAENLVPTYKQLENCGAHARRSRYPAASPFNRSKYNSAGPVADRVLHCTLSTKDVRESLRNDYCSCTEDARRARATSPYVSEKEMLFCKAVAEHYDSGGANLTPSQIEWLRKNVEGGSAEDSPVAK